MSLPDVTCQPSGANTTTDLTNTCAYNLGTYGGCLLNTQHAGCESMDTMAYPFNPCAYGGCTMAVIDNNPLDIEFEPTAPCQMETCKAAQASTLNDLQCAQRLRERSEVYTPSQICRGVKNEQYEKDSPMDKCTQTDLVVNCVEQAGTFDNLCEYTAPAAGPSPFDKCMADKSDVTTCLSRFGLGAQHGPDHFGAYGDTDLKLDTHNTLGGGPQVSSASHKECQSLGQRARISQYLTEHNLTAPAGTTNIYETYPQFTVDDLKNNTNWWQQWSSSA